MDPNETLRRLLRLATMVLDCDSDTGPESEMSLTDAAYAMAEHVESLDGWLSSGGFLPEKWGR